MPRIYLSNDASDVSGYKLAYVDMRSPNTTALSTSVTNTTGSGDNIAVTATAGGSAVKWITKPLLAATTLVTEVHGCIWAKESNASANASVGVVLDIYTAGAAGDVNFLDSDFGTELTTSAAQKRWTTAAATSQAFAAGDRLIVKLQVVAATAATMGGSQTVTIDYDGPTAGADGDTYFDVMEDFRVNETQVGSGASPYRSYGAASMFIRVAESLQLGIDAGYWTSQATVRQVLDQAAWEQNLIAPRTAVTTPT